METANANVNVEFAGVNLNQILARAEKDQKILGELVVEEVYKLLTAA